MISLEEALTNGRGTERPFQCPEHDDKQASASVNVVKGVWFCHACHAKGVTAGKRAPKVEELEAMLEPEAVARKYPAAWQETFLDWESPIYWDARFPRWLTTYLGMGQDPFTGSPTFPVHTASGYFAGVGRRNVDPTAKPKYKYPAHWSASVSLFGRVNGPEPFPIVALVEGAADAAAVIETGCPALATYGSGLHLPQIELLAQHSPKVVLLGFDMDEAGEGAVSRAFGQIGRMGELVRVKWGKKDPADTPLERRKADLIRAVGRTGYGSSTTLHWDARVADMHLAFARHLKEIA
ncbi:MAG TPA: toprim domain-containing protein [Ornithinibacter sp.]|nr:toprim domain-containing protein [Ornithinibacter sp.]